MAVTLDQAFQMLREPKWLILDHVEWSTEKGRKSDYLWRLKSRTRTLTTMPRGLWFRVTTWVDYPLVAVFQLECDYPSIKSHMVLHRLELNPFGTHRNNGWGPLHLCGLFIDAGVTHEHSFLHYGGLENTELSAGVDPMAAVTEDPPADFDSALLHVCAKLQIQNCGDIPPVPLQKLLV